jgi:hypothetical protein
MRGMDNALSWFDNAVKKELEKYDGPDPVKIFGETYGDSHLSFNISKILERYAKCVHPDYNGPYETYLHVKEKIEQSEGISEDLKRILLEDLKNMEGGIKKQAFKEGLMKVINHHFDLYIDLLEREMEEKYQEQKTGFKKDFFDRAGKQNDSTRQHAANNLSFSFANNISFRLANAKSSEEHMMEDPQFRPLVQEIWKRKVIKRLIEMARKYNIQYMDIENGKIIGFGMPLNIQPDDKIDIKEIRKEIQAKLDGWNQLLNEYEDLNLEELRERNHAITFLL